jgi:hypothetical protein
VFGILNTQKPYKKTPKKIFSSLLTITEHQLQISLKKISLFWVAISLFLIMKKQTSSNHRQQKKNSTPQWLREKKEND